MQKYFWLWLSMKSTPCQHLFRSGGGYASPLSSTLTVQARALRISHMSTTPLRVSRMPHETAWHFFNATRVIFFVGILYKSLRCLIAVTLSSHVMPKLSSERARICGNFESVYPLALTTLTLIRIAAARLIYCQHSGLVALVVFIFVSVENCNRRFGRHLVDVLPDSGSNVLLSFLCSHAIFTNRVVTSHLFSGRWQNCCN